MEKLFRFLARLPLGLAQSLGAGLGVLACVASPAYRRKIADNLARAGVPARRLWECAAQAGRMVGELPFVWFAPIERVLAKVSCEDAAIVDEAVREGRGIVLLTPHLGAFELTARWYAARGKLTVLFKPPKQPALGRLLRAARDQGQMRSQPTNLAGVRAMLRALRAGETVGLLPDQVPDAGMGVWVPFFGEPAYTLTLPRRLAQSTGAAVILLWSERLATGAGWRLHIERLLDAPAPEALNSAMQRLILSCPSQYLWGYSRYRQPRGGEA